METNNQIQETTNHKLTDTGTLINSLRSEDEKYMRISKAFQVIYWIFIVLYVLLYIINPGDEYQMIDRISGISYILGFLCFALYFRKYYKELKSTDYAASTVKMLKNTIKRYKLFQARTAFVLVPLLFLDIGLTISFVQVMEGYTMINRILIIQAYYFSAMIVSFLIGILIWYKQQKPLRDKAQELLLEIEA